MKTEELELGDVKTARDEAIEAFSEIVRLAEHDSPVYRIAVEQLTSLNYWKSRETSEEVLQQWRPSYRGFKVGDRVFLSPELQSAYCGVELEVVAFDPDRNLIRWQKAGGGQKGETAPEHLLTARSLAAEALWQEIKEEADELSNMLQRGRSYHGAEKHSSDWHDGWESCARSLLDSLRLALSKNEGEKW